jgi:curved DNA-binding protein CbpA
MSEEARDAYETLGLEHRLSLTRDEIDAAYHTLSRERHPDAGGTTEDFADLTWARELLISPAQRARHLLDLAWPGTVLAGEVPAEMLVLFQQISGPLAAADEWRRKREKGLSVLQKALLEREALALDEQLEDGANQISEAMTALETSFDQWEGEPDSLAQMARTLAFLEKWDGQLREKRLALMMASGG